MSLVVHTDADSASVVSAVRAKVRELDPDLPLGDVLPLTEVLSGAAAQPRFRAMLFVCSPPSRCFWRPSACTV